MGRGCWPQQGMPAARHSRHQKRAQSQFRSWGPLQWAHPAGGHAATMDLPEPASQQREGGGGGGGALTQESLMRC